MCTKVCSKRNLLKKDIALTSWNYPCKRPDIRVGYFNTFERREHVFRF